MHTLRSTLALLLIVLMGCAGLGMPSGLSSSDSLEWAKLTNARGCMYIGLDSTTFLTSKFKVIGSWGADPPKYADCFNGASLMGMPLMQGFPVGTGANAPLMMPGGTPLMTAPYGASQPQAAEDQVHLTIGARPSITIGKPAPAPPLMAPAPPPVEAPPPAAP